MICNELLDVCNSINNLLYLLLVGFQSHLPGHKDASERSKVLFLAVSLLVGKDQRVGLDGELDVDADIDFRYLSGELVTTDGQKPSEVLRLEDCIRSKCPIDKVLE